jgi:hypothetical protein
MLKKLIELLTNRKYDPETGKWLPRKGNAR